MTQNKTHIPLLDAYRFFAAMAVVSFHYFGDVHAYTYRVNLEYGNIFNFPSFRFLEYGAFGVDLFFLISGFVIALSADGRSFTSFLSSRVARIVPTYWLAITLTTILLLISDPSEVAFRKLFANFAFLQKPLGEEPIDVVYWTIAVEFRFYILVSVLIAIGAYRYYHWLLLGWVLLCFSDYFGLQIGFLHKLFITSYGYYFAGGGALYHLYSKQHIKLSIITILLSLLIAIPIRIEQSIVGEGIIIGLVIVSCYALMAIIVTRRFDSSVRLKWFTIAGAVTYPLYLLHLRIGVILMEHITMTANGFVLNLFIIMIMLFASWLVHRYFEQQVCPWVRKQIEKHLSSLMIMVPFILQKNK